MPNGYSVGNLELDITALDKSATSFKNVIDRLSTMLGLVQELSTAFRGLGQINNFANGLAKIAKIDLKPVADNIQKIPEAVKPLVNLGAGFKGLGQLTNFANGLQKIAQVNTPDVYKKINSIVRTVAPLQGFGESFKGLGQLTNFANGLQKIAKLDMSLVDKQIQSLTATLRPFLNELTVATPALTAFSTAMASLKGRRMIGFKQFDQSGGGSKNIAKTLNLASILGKVYFIRNYTKQLGQSVAKIVQMGVDYAETLNLWQVAMRGNISTAEEFISKMNKAYGIAEETLMRYQATFRNMLSTLGGVSTDVSYALSEYLTQMALDYASLYNTSIERAMTVFQSVLSGQVRPIRSISGYDITETTIFELYQQLGGTKTMRQLTQTEKRLLRIYAVFQQMDRSGAIGDLNKTLNNTANQMRIMSESAKELGVWIGKMVELYVAPALPYLNAFLITAKNIAQAITKSLPNYSEFDGTIKGYEETAEAMDEVQGKLLDFDKFRSLSGQEENSLGIGIDENLIAGLTQYQSILDNVSNKATELAEKWTSWWVDDETGKLTEQGQAVIETLKSIGILLGGLVALKLTSKVIGLAKALVGVGSALTTIKDSMALLSLAKGAGLSLSETATGVGGVSSSVLGLANALKFLTSPIGIILSIVGVLYIANEDFRESINGLLKTLAPILKLALDLISQVLKPIIPLIGGILDLAGKILAVGVKIITGIVYFAEMFVGFFIIPIEAAVKVVGTLITLLETLFTWNWSALGDKLSNLWKNWGSFDFIGNAKLSIDNLVSGYKTGGLVEDGLFTMNKGEVMGTFDDGTSIVANNQQIISDIKQGVYQAVSQAMANSGTSDDRPIDIYIDGEKVFQATKKNAKRHGLAFSKV